MAKAETDGKPAGETTEKVIPSASAIIAESVAGRQAAIADAAGLPADTTTTTVDKPATDDKPAELTQEQYDKWWNAQPENLRNATIASLYRSYNDAIGKEYGDILPTIVAARENPALRELLVELGDATKKELIEGFTDPEVRKNAKYLTKGELRDFLFGEAVTTYNKYVTPPKDAPADKTPADLRVEQLEQRMDDEAVAREMDPANQAGYIQQRGREVKAVASAFSQFTPKHLEHVIDVVEGRYERAALKAGIDTSKEGWQVRAARKGIAHPGYRDEAARYAEVLGKSADAAPIVADKKPGAAGDAAPRDTSEAKKLAGVTALREFKSKSPAFQRKTTRS